MLSSRVNWNLLHMFVVLADAQNISRAAEILGRGQPAVSAAGGFAFRCRR